MIETVVDGEKVLNMADTDFKGQAHEQATFIQRKRLQERFQGFLDDYMILNGVALTSLHSRVSNL